MNINIRKIAFLNGIILCGFSTAVFIPLLCDILINEGRCAYTFLVSFFVSLFLGGCLIFAFKTNENFQLTKQDGFLIVVSFWLIISIFGAFPFYFYREFPLSFVSSFMESASGITVTGISVYEDVESLARSIVLWRFILQFIGGVGIVAIGIVIFPMLRIGGMQLFYNENSDRSKKFLPRVSQISMFFFITYASIICVIAVLLILVGMSGFDATCHAISAVATGGFSTKNAGIAYFESSAIELVLTLGMFIGGLNFIEVIKCFKIGVMGLFKNTQIRGYFIIILSASLIVVISFIVLNNEVMSIKEMIHNIFTIVSFSTTTCFSEDTLSDIIPFFHMLVLILGVIGGCSGSTTGGVKVFRIQILFAVISHHIKIALRPFDVSGPRYQGQKIQSDLVVSVISYFILLFLSFIISVFVLGITEDSLLVGCGATYSCIFNIGLPIDHFCDFEHNINDIHTLSKIVLVIDMIIGRLEVIPFFMIMSRYFWK